MKDDEIKIHTRKYYSLLFKKDYRCHLNVSQGKRLALELGYPSDLIDRIPIESWYAFFPCGNPLSYLKPLAGDSILNIGCGIGIDSIALNREYTSSVQIYNLDVIDHILLKSKKLISHLVEDIKTMHWICADADTLPFQSSSFNWIMMNGAFNLIPAKNKLLSEIYRIMKPYGKLLVADLSCRERLEEYFSQEPDAWAWCMSGAYTEEDLIPLLQSSGFSSIKITRTELDRTFNRIIFLCQKT
ncbi:MAG: methyltransferase domain-containing protein [Spirochaetota bacterium]|nr:methyltransferase domain-containing protein [Spirochaetota bacterium]